MSNFVRKFYIADTHFGHEAIIRYCKRPFVSVVEMDAYMIDQWNAVVMDTDIVYHLGDFCLGDAEYAQSIFSQLRGRKFLILGNHDTRRGSPLPHIMALDWEQPPSPTRMTSDEGRPVFLSHYAHRTWPGQHRGCIHFYGHSHNTIPHLGASRDVGVDCKDVEFRPRTFRELTTLLPVADSE